MTYTDRAGRLCGGMGVTPFDRALAYLGNHGERWQPAGHHPAGDETGGACVGYALSWTAAPAAAFDVLAEVIADLYPSRVGHVVQLPRTALAEVRWFDAHPDTRWPDISAVLHEAAARWSRRAMPPGRVA